MRRQAPLKAWLAERGITGYAQAQALKTYVALMSPRCKSAQVQATTRTRVDLGSS